MSSLEKSKVNTATGFDNLPLKLLRDGRHYFAPFLAMLFNQSLDSGFLPSEFHVARLASFVKPGKPPEDPSSYRNISVLISLFRILDGIIADRTYDFTEAKISNAQGGFRKALAHLNILYPAGNCFVSVSKRVSIVFGFC